MKPEEFSCLGMYGNRNVFERRLREGYTEVAHGGGEWVGAQRIVSIWAFFHPKKFFKRVATYEHPKFDNGVHTVRGAPFEETYTERGFRKYCEKGRIRLGERENLTEVLGNWDK